MAEALRWLYAGLMILSSAASIGGNLLLLLVLVLNQDMRSDTLVLALSCGLSDLALGLSALPFGAHNSLWRPAGWPSEGILCQGSGFLVLLLQTASVHSGTWTTVDKFTEIRLAFSYGRLWTARRCRAVLALVWLFCLVNASLPLLGIGGYVYSESRFLCVPDFGPDRRSFVVPWMAVSIAAPVLVSCCLYGYMVSVARKQARRGTFMCNELHCFYVPANTYLRSSVVMVSRSACLLICWLPYVSVGLYETFSGQPSPAISSALSTWLVLTSSALNPWITCVTQTRYRSALRRSVSRFLQRFRETPRPQTAVIHLSSTDRISTTTTETRPPSPPATHVSLGTNSC